MHRVLRPFAVSAILFASSLFAQARAVVPDVATTLPGNAAISMPLRWSQGFMQVWIAQSLLPTAMAGGTLRGVRLRRPAILGEPSYPAITRTITVRAGFTLQPPTDLGDQRLFNMPSNALVVAGPAPFAVGASAPPVGVPVTGDEFLVIPFSTPLPVQPGTLCLEFETSDAPLAVGMHWVDAVSTPGGVDRGYVVAVGDGSCTTRTAPLQLTWTGANGPQRGSSAALRVLGAPPAAPNGPGSLVLALVGVEPQTHALVGGYFGFGAPLGLLDPGLAGCFQWSPLDLVFFGLADAAGGFDIGFPIPVAGTTRGMRVGVQAAFLDPARAGALQFSVSNGVVLQLDTTGLGATCSTAFFPGTLTRSPWPVDRGLMPVLVLDY